MKFILLYLDLWLDKVNEPPCWLYHCLISLIWLWGHSENVLFALDSSWVLVSLGLAREMNSNNLFTRPLEWRSEASLLWGPQSLFFVFSYREGVEALERHLGDRGWCIVILGVESGTYPQIYKAVQKDLISSDVNVTNRGCLLYSGNFLYIFCSMNEVSENKNIWKFMVAR